MKSLRSNSVSNDGQPNRVSNRTVFAVEKMIIQIFLQDVPEKLIELAWMPQRCCCFNCLVSTLLHRSGFKQEFET